MRHVTVGTLHQDEGLPPVIATEMAKTARQGHHGLFEQVSLTTFVLFTLYLGVTLIPPLSASGRSQRVTSEHMVKNQNRYETVGKAITHPHKNPQSDTSAFQIPPSIAFPWLKDFFKDILKDEVKIFWKRIRSKFMVFYLRFGKRKRKRKRQK